MSEINFLFYKKMPIGKFIENGDILTYESIEINAKRIPNGLGFPIGLFPVSETWFSPQSIDSNHIPTKDDIYLWLSDRVFPEDRQGAEFLLHDLGLNSYDMWQIAKRTKAISMNDYYWIAKSLEEKYEDVHPRHRLDTKNEVKHIISKDSADISGRIVVRLGTTADPDVIKSNILRKVYSFPDTFNQSIKSRKKLNLVLKAHKRRNKSVTSVLGSDLNKVFQQISDLDHAFPISISMGWTIPHSVNPEGIVKNSDSIFLKIINNKENSDLNLPKIKEDE
ncbi:hypothetical protein FE783_35845 [Paenibacillus mesophilus]|uniref:hypothetical protein n=1 Tax=Paenibacillus mesophilus TaxID=2582849 RepID=UPI00110E877D|nr:hypothetical protein [Paenibacillus mesophilus]TMV43193.1 hypothetical protein FE783_35845 [Paenibacillus mesophilus]